MQSGTYGCLGAGDVKRRAAVVLQLSHPVNDLVRPRGRVNAKRLQESLQDAAGVVLAAVVHAAEAHVVRLRDELDVELRGDVVARVLLVANQHVHDLALVLQGDRHAEDGEGVGRGEGVELEFGHDAEGGACAAEGPEQVWVLGG